MRKFLILFCCFLLCTACARQQTPQLKFESSTSEDRIGQYIEDLTHKKFTGRQGGTQGEAQAALYLARFLKKAGLKPGGDGETFFQSFPIGKYEPVLMENRMTFRQVSGKESNISENVLGVLPGKKEDVIVVSAHYDHLGTVEGKLYPGANDNASGVALVMELVNSLKGQVPPYTILFAFWGAEEKGLLGSSFFSENPTIPLEKIKCVVNLDSLGNLGEDQVLLGWPGGENEISKGILGEFEREGWKIHWEKTEKHSSDHLPFAKKGIAAFTLLSPRWLEKNHTPMDTMEIINKSPLGRLLIPLKKGLVS
ncbi:M20/M25/M40 family metallo-hydrolase [Thermanaerosceptrum fracticalcis]|uniref:M20/M25/M40 family metallo-hydrolase n=1 Tax=Thermanaerosceptrum fracticalcis TaxID=1712410 RepID=A0A7G6DZI8_THEFR|nr:M28 family peptidase [Thermanaerosceptrum fracticalcis]QNB45242.1 M20/M25/M40 family metallo-hydrolase [Thermanaerosceptrum fracticalcis]